MRRLVVLLFLLPMAPLWACIWDSDTLRDEAHIKSTKAFNLITGQFAHHGTGYYNYRVRSAKLALASDSNNVDVLNDLGVAQFKLGHFEEALQTFARLDAIEPDRYTTLSNLGVLHKKKSDFVQASAYTKLALELNPAGHLGLGDYYLKALDYRQKPPADSSPYKAYYQVGDPEHQPDEKRLESMIRSDRRFPDALAAYGDFLHDRMDLNHALWAYVRALALGHPQPTALNKKIDGIWEHWTRAVEVQRNGNHIEDRAKAIARIEAKLAEADVWLEAFERIEGEIIAGKANDAERALVSFETVETELERLGIKRVEPLNVGVLDAGEASGAGISGKEASGMLLWVFVLALVAMSVAVLTFRRR